MQESSTTAGRLPDAAQILLLAVAYFAAAKLSLLLAIPPGYATPVWPPSGIAFAAALLLGNRIWPGIWLGAAVANITVEASLATALAIATGNTLEALAGATLVRRFIGVPRRFDRGEDVVTFVAAAALSATIAATIGLVPLAVSHTLPWQAVFSNWWTWWQGDLSGIIIVTPLVLTWSTRHEMAWSRGRMLELACFAVLLVASARLAFADGAIPPGIFPLRFAVLPFIIWAAFRFSQREVATGIAAVSAIAVWDLLHGLGSHSSLNEALLVLLAFNSTVVVTGLALSAVVGERSRAMDGLRERHAVLESQVEERTRDLETSNRALHLDIAERERMEKLLLESELRIRTLIDSVQDYAIFMLDPAGRVASWNEGARKIKGYAAEEIMGRSFACFYTQDDVAAGKPPLVLATAAREGHHEYEGWRRRKDGSRFWANVVVTAMRDPAGRLIGYSEVARDLSERKSAEIKMEDARNAAEKANRAKSEFLAKMSHELRTPLNSLLILARLLADNAYGNLTPKQVKYAETIHDAGMDLLAVINDVLDLARIESGAITALDMSPVNFAALQSYVESAFRQVAHQKGLRFDVSIDERLPATMPTDARRLQQILKNLLSNAFKFTKQGGVSLSIVPAEAGWARGHGRLDRAGAVVAFSVMDTGIGIAGDKQELIFEAFQQADGTTSRQYGGTGLGLSISREFTRLLGGDLRVDSSPGCGATFTLYLSLEHEAQGGASILAAAAEARDA